MGVDYNALGLVMPYLLQRFVAKKYCGPVRVRVIEWTRRYNSLRSLVTARRGVAMVEFALVAPITVLLFVSFIQVGFVLSSYVTVTDAARQGARTAITQGLTDAQRTTAARKAIFPNYPDCAAGNTGFAQSTGNIDCTNGVSVTLPAANPIDHPNRRGQTLEVQVTWLVTMDVGVFTNTPDLTVTARSKMRID